MRCCRRDHVRRRCPHREASDRALSSRQQISRDCSCRSAFLFGRPARLLSARMGVRLGWCPRPLPSEACLPCRSAAHPPPHARRPSKARCYNEGGVQPSRSRVHSAWKPHLAQSLAASPPTSCRLPAVLPPVCVRVPAGDVSPWRQNQQPASLPVPWLERLFSQAHGPALLRPGRGALV